jgi:hypothetical protein
MATIRYKMAHLASLRGNIQVNRDRLAQALLEQFWESYLRDENEQVIAIDRVPSLDLDEQRARSVAAADRKAS